MSLSEETRLELLKMALTLGNPAETTKQYRFMSDLLEHNGTTRPNYKAYRSIDGKIYKEAIGEEAGPTAPSATVHADLAKGQEHSEAVILSHRISSMETEIDGSGNPHQERRATEQKQPSGPCSQKQPKSRHPLPYAQSSAGSSHHTSSSPSSDETHPTDSQSTGRDESVADEIGNYAPPLRAFARTLTDQDLNTVASFGMPYWADRVLQAAARAEIERRGNA